MSRPGYKTKSDTMLLRRLINNLRERGSEVAGELERKAHNFLTDVQMKRKTIEVSGVYSVLRLYTFLFNQIDNPRDIKCISSLSFKFCQIWSLVSTQLLPRRFVIIL